MGAWGTGPFDNDDAADLLGELQTEGVGLLRETLEEVTALGPDGYLEAPAASRAIGAAEIVAASRGSAAPDLPPSTAQWIATSGSSDDELVALSAEAVNRVLTNSELKDLWAETPDSASWSDRLSDLSARLR